MEKYFVIVSKDDRDLVFSGGGGWERSKGFYPLGNCQNTFPSSARAQRVIDDPTLWGIDLSGCSIREIQYLQVDGVRHVEFVS